VRKDGAYACAVPKAYANPNPALTCSPLTACMFNGQTNAMQLL